MPSTTKKKNPHRVFKLSYTLKSQQEVQKTQFVHIKKLQQSKHDSKHFTATCVRNVKPLFCHPNK